MAAGEDTEKSIPAYLLLARPKTAIGVTRVIGRMDRRNLCALSDRCMMIESMRKGFPFARCEARPRAIPTLRGQ